MLALPPELAELAVAGLRDVINRSNDGSAIAAVSGMLPSLAQIAAITSDTSMTAEIRVLCRVARRQTPPAISTRSEFETCLIACAAHRSFQAYADLLGEWMEELSQSAMSHKAAFELNYQMQTILYRKPVLWAKLGAAYSLSGCRARVGALRTA
jgi:hypothetical protein